jgi:hypothetical protein
MNEIKRHGIDLKDKEELLVKGVRPALLQNLTISKNVTYTKAFTASNIKSI